MDDAARRAKEIAQHLADSTNCVCGPDAGPCYRTANGWQHDCRFVHDAEARIATALRELEAERDEEKRLHREHTIQWGKRVVDLTLERDALATRLALAEQQTHADRMTIDDLLSEREQSRARLARVEAALTPYKEYVAFLERENEGPVTLAFAHGWRCPQGVVDKGVAYRARIAALTPDATTEGT